MLQKRILISGYYGFGNTGDEAILQSILAGLRSKNKDLEFTVISGEPARTMRNHNVHAIAWTNINETIEAARQSDLIILGGGGLFQDYHQASVELTLTPQQWGIPYYSSFALLASLTNKPFMLYSVGVGPLFAEDGRQMTRMAFEVADKATVRDVESFNLLKSLNINTEKVAITADPAFLLEPEYDEARKILAALNDPVTDTTNLVGVCVRKWDIGVSEEEWQRSLAGALDGFIEKHRCKIVFIPFQNVENVLTNDSASAAKVIEYMKHKENAQVIAGEQPVSTLNGLIGKCRIFVGMRLHSLIFSAKETVPPIALVYDGKVSNLMNGLSLGKYALSLFNLTSEQLLDAMEESWNKGNEIRSHLQEVREKMREGALKNIDIALELLEGTAKFERPHVELSQNIRLFALKQTRLLSESGQKYTELHERYSNLIDQFNNLNTEKEALIQSQNVSIQQKDAYIQQQDSVIAQMVSQANQLAFQINQLTYELNYYHKNIFERSYLWSRRKAGAALRWIFKLLPERTKHPLKKIYLKLRYGSGSLPANPVEPNRQDQDSKPQANSIQVTDDKMVNILTPQFFDMDGAKVFLGGAERYLVELVKMLKEQGFKPHVYQGSSSKWDREFEGMQISGLDSGGADNDQIRHIFLSKVPQGGLNIYLAFYLASLGAKPRSIGISHGVYWDETGFQEPGSWEKRLSLILDSFQNLDKVVSVDTNTINWVRGMRTSLADKFTYIPNFVDSTSFKPLENRAKGGKIRIVYPRRLYKARGFWLVREVMEDLLAQYPHVEFHFVGQANAPEEVEARKLTLKYPQRVYWYDLPFDRMYEAYQKADITVIPTINSEGTSLSCLEAMATRNTIVATNVGGLTDLIIPGYNGMLIEPRPASLSEALHQLIEDSDLRETLAKNAYETARVFEINQWKMKWAKLIAEFYE